LTQQLNITIKKFRAAMLRRTLTAYSSKAQRSARAQHAALQGKAAARLFVPEMPKRMASALPAAFSPSMAMERQGKQGEAHAAPDA
jgi:hypothetical protein